MSYLNLIYHYVGSDWYSLSGDKLFLVIWVAKVFSLNLIGHIFCMVVVVYRFQ